MNIQEVTLLAILGWAFFARSIRSAPWPKPHPMDLVNGLSTGLHDTSGMRGMNGAKQAAQSIAGTTEGSKDAFQGSRTLHELEAVPPPGQQPSATAEISSIRNPHNPTLKMAPETQAIKSPPWTTRLLELFPSLKMRLPREMKVESLEDELYLRAPFVLSRKSHDAAAARFLGKSEENPPSALRKLLNPVIRWWQTRHEIPVQELVDELEKKDLAALSVEYYAGAVELHDATPASKGSLLDNMKFTATRTQKTPSPPTPIQAGDDTADVIEVSESSARMKRLGDLFSSGKTKISEFFRERKALSLADELYKLEPDKLTYEARELAKYRRTPPPIKLLMWLGLKPETWGSRLSNLLSHYSGVFKTKWNNSGFGKMRTFFANPRRARVVKLGEQPTIVKLFKENPVMKALKQWNQDRRDRKVTTLVNELEKVDPTKLAASDDPLVPNHT